MNVVLDPLEFLSRRSFIPFSLSAQSKSRFNLYFWKSEERFTGIINDGIYGSSSQQFAHSRKRTKGNFRTKLELKIGN